MSNTFDKKIVNGEVALKLLQGLKTKVDSADIQATRVKGVLDISNIPQSALPTLVVVQTDEERFQLTQDRVKKGDTVKVVKTNKLYLVTDTSRLSSSEGYTEYSQTVDWGNIEGKPSSFPPSVHTQTSDSISSMKLYTKGSDTSDITTSDNLNTAIGKLEAKLDIKLNRVESGLNGEKKDVVESLNNNVGQFIRGKIDNINQITQQGWYLCNAGCEGSPTSFEGIVVNFMCGDSTSVKVWYSITQESMYIKQDIAGAVKQEWTQLTTKSDFDSAKEEILGLVNTKQDKIDQSLITSSKEVVGAINELHTNKQNATDLRLTTSSKDVVPAINELKDGKADLVHNHDDMYTRTEEITRLLAGKEDTIIKATAFNKDFGITEGTVADGKVVADLKEEVANISDKVAPMIEGKLDKTGGKITGNLEIDGKLVTKNNVGVQCKDNSGIAKTMIYMDNTDSIKVGDGNISVVIDSDDVTLKGGKTLWHSQNFEPSTKQDVNNPSLLTENKTVVGSINETLTETRRVSSELSTKAPLVHDHDDRYTTTEKLNETVQQMQADIQAKEPIIAEKGDAFNKNFGTSVGTVLEGKYLPIIEENMAKKQDKTDISLQTSNKTIVGAINEIKANTISSTGGNIDGAIQSKEYNGRGNYNIVTAVGTGGSGTVHGTFSGRAKSSTGVGEILVYNKTASSGIRFKDDGNVTIEGKSLTAQANNLQTSAKDVVGAINELNANKLSLSGGTMRGHADMLKLDTSKASDSAYIKFLNNGVEKGWMGKGSSSTDSIAIHNSTSNKGMTFRHDGSTLIDATNLKTTSKEVVGAINELLTSKLSVDGSNRMKGSMNFDYGSPSVPNIKFLDSNGGMHGSLNARGGDVDEDIYLENNTGGNGLFLKDNGEVHLSSKKMRITAPNLETNSKEIIGAINELNTKKLGENGGVLKGNLTIGTNDNLSKGRIVGTDNTLALATPADEANYLTFVKNNASSSERKGYIGFGSESNNNMDIRNDATNKALTLNSDGTLRYDGNEVYHRGNFNPNTKLDTGWLQGRTLTDYNVPAKQGIDFNYGTASATGKPIGRDHAVMTMGFSSDWFYQMAGDWRTGDLFVRGSNNNPSSVVWHKAFTTGSCPISKSRSGYCKLANGLIIQWGEYTPPSWTNNTTYYVSLPTSFSSGASYSISLNANYISQGYRTPVIGGGSESGGRFYLFHTSGLTGSKTKIEWLAIGY